MDNAVTFGKNNSLVGILSTVAEAVPVRDIAVICLNAGLLHRVGPFRMNVELSSLLVEQGFQTLRFDCSSVGDSGSANQELDYLSQVTEDIKAAADLVTSRTGIKRFVIFGLCTGADNAHRAIVADERFVGGIFLDGYGYPSFKYRLKRYLPILLNPLRIIRILVRLGKTRFNEIFGPPSEAENAIFTWILPPKDHTEQDFKLLINRNVKLLHIFSGNEIMRYNYQEQYFDSMPFLKKHRDQFAVLFNSEADHTYCLYHDRLKLYDQVLAWLEKV